MPGEYPPGVGARAAAAAAGAFGRLGAAEAASILRGLGPFISGAGPAGAFLLGWELGNQLYDYLNPAEKGPLPEDFGLIAKQGSVAGVSNPGGWSTCGASGSTCAPGAQLLGLLYDFAGGCVNLTCTATGQTPGITSNGASIGIRAAYEIWHAAPSNNNHYGMTYYTPVLTQAGDPSLPVANRTAAQVVPARAFDNPDYLAGELPQSLADGVAAPRAGWPFLSASTTGVRGYDDRLPAAAAAIPVPGIKIGDNDIPVALPDTIAGAPPGVREITTVVFPPQALPRIESIIKTSSWAEVARPAPNTKETKLSSYKMYARFKFLVNAVTESRDLLEAVWKALPKGCRKPYKGPHGKKRKTRPNEMVMDLRRAFWNSSGGFLKCGNTLVSFDEFTKNALKEMISNELQDNFYGRAGRAYASAARRLNAAGYYDRPVGFQAGDRYRPNADHEINRMIDAPNYQKGFRKPPSGKWHDQIADFVVDSVW